MPKRQTVMWIVPQPMRKPKDRNMDSTVNSSLTWASHVDYLCAKLSSQIFALRQLKSCVDNSTLRTVYYSLIHTEIDLKDAYYLISIHKIYFISSFLNYKFNYLPFVLNAAPYKYPRNFPNRSLISCYIQLGTHKKQGDGEIHIHTSKSIYTDATPEKQDRGTLRWKFNPWVLKLPGNIKIYYRLRITGSLRRIKIFREIF
nr:unnamed protein product [Callosobruchus chinensis]